MAGALPGHAMGMVTLLAGLPSHTSRKCRPGYMTVAPSSLTSVRALAAESASVMDTAPPAGRCTRVNSTSLEMGTGCAFPMRPITSLETR